MRVVGGDHGQAVGCRPFDEGPSLSQLAMFAPIRECARSNSGERRSFYAASRINQLRKSSSAASQPSKPNMISYLRVC